MTQFQPTKCDHCHQTKNYSIALDKGTASILLAFLCAITHKGINRIHTNNEMVIGPSPAAGGFANYQDMIAAGKITSRMEGNKSRARFHGLIASIDNGEHVLTQKGARFLNGEPVPRIAIIDKVTGHNTGYWNENDTVTIGKIMRNETAWWQVDIPSTALTQNLQLPIS